MSEEYFIRNDENDDNRGPFDMDQLATLADAGKINQETLFYVEGDGCWKLLKDMPELYEKLFPKKEAIRLKLASPKTQDVQKIPSSSDDQAEEEKGVSVAEVLDSAEGRTEETEYLRKAEKEKNKAASASLPVLGLSFLLFAFAIGWGHYDFLNGVITERDWGRLLSRPIIFVFVIDLLLGLGLLLGASELFPIARLRAMVGLGFLPISFGRCMAMIMPWQPQPLESAQ